MASLRPLLAGNWKMNGMRESLGEIALVRDAISAGKAGRGDLLLCPPFTLLMPAADLCTGTALAIGAQDCEAGRSGAATGDISAEMLKDAGARAVIVGHSERRAQHGETDEVVRSKAEAAARAGLVAIICLGENRAEHDRGETLRVIGRQLDDSVPPTASGNGIAIAYEPVWAIGTGHTSSEDDIAEVHGFIRRRLKSLIGSKAADVRLLYGGSVKPENAAEVLGIEDVNGVLVGGASLDAREFLAIAAACR